MLAAMSGSTQTPPASPAEGLATTLSGGAPAPSVVLPDRVGRYRIAETLGQGAMGTVVAAYDEALERRVAIKFLRRASHAGARARLEREAQTLASLAHPRIVRIYEVGEHEGRPYLVMEFIEGRTLRRWWTDDAPPYAERLRALVEAGRGLEAAHAAGIIHRDFKPDNVLVDRRGAVRVVDFGLARAGEGTARSETSPHFDTTSDDVLTRSGAVIGTPAYMAPEQHRGRVVDARADQFAFCVTAWEALFGARPFTGDYAALTFAILHGRITAPPSRQGVPRAVERALRRGLAVDPERRWPSMTALLDALTRRRRRAPWVLAGVGVFAIAIAVATRGRGEAPCTTPAEVDAGWPAASLARLEAQLGASPDPAVRTPWQQAQRELGTWRSALREAATRSCTANAPEARTCVEESLARTQVLLATLETFPSNTLPRVVPRLPDAVPTGVPPAPCRMPAVGTPEHALWHELRRVETEARLGQTDAARERWTTLAPRVQATGRPELAAELEFLRGRIADVERRSSDAQVAYEAAYFHAHEGVHPRVAIDAARSLLVLTAATPARIEEAKRWARLAHAQAERAGLPLERARVDALLAPLLYMAGEQAASQALFESTSTALEAGLGPRSPELWDFRLRFAMLLTDTADLERAQELSRGALAAYRERYGDRSLKVAATLGILGGIASNSDETDRATEYFAEALEIYRAILPPDDVRIANAMANYGRQLYRAHRPDEAEAQLEGALAIYARQSGPRPRGIAQASTALAWLLRNRGEIDRALQALQRALEAQAENLPPDHPDRGNTLLQMALAELDRGQTEAAFLHLRRAEAIHRKVYGDDSVPMATLLHVRSMLFDAQRDDASARADLAAARAILERRTEPPPPDLWFRLRMAEAWSLHRQSADAAALLQYVLLLGEHGMLPVEVRPPAAALHHQAARVALAAGAIDLAIAWADAILAAPALPPTDRALAEVVLAEAHGRRGAQALARRFAAQAEARWPADLGPGFDEARAQARRWAGTRDAIAAR